MPGPKPGALPLGHIPLWRTEQIDFTVNTAFIQSGYISSLYLLAYAYYRAAATAA